MHLLTLLVPSENSQQRSFDELQLLPAVHAFGNVWNKGDPAAFTSIASVDKIITILFS